MDGGPCTFPCLDVPRGRGELRGGCTHGDSWLLLGSLAQPSLEDCVIVLLHLQVFRFINSLLWKRQLVKQGEKPPFHNTALARSSWAFQSLFHLPLAELHEPTEAGTDSPRHGSYFYQLGGNGIHTGA